MGRKQPPRKLVFPFTYWVFGRPVSTRNDDGTKPAGLSKWRAVVSAAATEAIESASKGRGFVLAVGPVEVRIFWLSVDPRDPAQPDIDNILKPLIDALNAAIIEDDRQVHRLLAEKASINSPPNVIEDIMKDIQDDERYVPVGEVIIVQVFDFAPEQKL